MCLRTAHAVRDLGGPVGEVPFKTYPHGTNRRPFLGLRQGQGAAARLRVSPAGSACARRLRAKYYRRPFLGLRQGQGAAARLRVSPAGSACARRLRAK